MSALKIIKKGSKEYVYDMIRSKFVKLTPEEHVRQLFVHYMVSELDYPKGLLSNEVEIALGGTRKRCDTVLFNRQMHPVMIVEYKAPHIPITSEVVAQIYRYNMELRAEYLVVTNGRVCYCWQIDYTQNKMSKMEALPKVEDMEF